MTMIDPNNRYNLLATVIANVSNPETREMHRADVRSEGDAVSLLLAHPSCTRLVLQNEISGRVFRMWERDGDDLSITYANSNAEPVWFG